jgi:acyl-coenzyme A synthetase/AMP-(fatty) acid ligase
MPQSDCGSLWDALSASGHLFDRSLGSAEASVILADLARGSSLGGRLGELRGRSVLVATRDQLTAALALIELDGIARRLVLCPPGQPSGHVSSVIIRAAVDAVVSDRAAPPAGTPDIGCLVTCSPRIAPAESERSGRYQTEWILLTSGTTGLPKLVLHTLSSLTAAVKGGTALGAPVIWSTFYDIRRYGGLQIFLRALLGGGSLVLSGVQESMGDFLIRAGACGVTHISGTPSHWRRALMSPSARRIAPQYVRLSGEIADQAILDSLRAFYPEARIAHAFASTEAGVAFEVGDGLAGFPASLIGRPGADVEMKVEDGSLRIRSAGIAIRSLGDRGETLADEDGFVDTGDMVELHGDRFDFVGRRGGIINVGGLKVHPEEVEAVINSHPSVQMSLVKARKNAITGAIVVADVVATYKLGGQLGTAETDVLKSEIIEACRRALAPHKVPATIHFVPSLDVAASGKLARVNA